MFGFGKKDRVPALRLSAVSLTDAGLVRPANEDNLLLSRSTCVYCVADGMGGGAEGAKASAIVCRELRMMMTVVEPGYESRVRAARRAIVDANAVIHQYAVDHGLRQMGSTVAALIFDADDGDRATVIHVGDSRVYRIRGGIATALTRDHSVGFELSDFAGAEAAAYRDRSNPLSHILTRAIGVMPDVQSDVREIDVRRGDRYLLCTDGVHDVISDARLAIFAGGGTLESAQARLAAEIRKVGAPDNLTFILIAVS